MDDASRAGSSDMGHIKESHGMLAAIEDRPMRFVLLESPLASPTIEGWVRHKKYARAAARDCFARGEAPYASHLLYAQEGLIDDDVARERAIGIHAGLEWGKHAEVSVVYGDLGISSGMARGIERARREGRPVEYRMLGQVEEPTAKEIALEALRREVQAEMKATQAVVAPRSLDPAAPATRKPGRSAGRSLSM